MRSSSSSVCFNLSEALLASAELQRHTAAVMLEERACEVARCGKSEDVCPLGIGADDVGPCCCVVMHGRDLLQRVVGPSREKAAQAYDALADAGSVVGPAVGFGPLLAELAIGGSSQRCLPDVHGTLVHEAEPWGCEATGRVRAVATSCNTSRRC